MNPPDWLDGWGALLIILALVILNLWQFYKYHHVTGKLSGELAHLLRFGHDPSAPTIVPSRAPDVDYSVVRATDGLGNRTTIVPEQWRK